MIKAHGEEIAQWVKSNPCLYVRVDQLWLHTTMRASLYWDKAKALNVENPTIEPISGKSV